MIKINSQNRFAFLSVFIATFLSIQLPARELPGDWQPAPQLGNAYFSDQHRVIATQCLEGKEVDVGQAIGDLRYTTEADFEKIASAFSGSVSARLSVPFVKASASLNYARENAATTTRMN